MPFRGPGAARDDGIDESIVEAAGDRPGKCRNGHYGVDIGGEFSAYLESTSTYR